VIGLLGAGSAAIHQLRYAIGYGDAAPHALAAHGHGYLEIALPGLTTAMLIAVAGVLMRAAGARRERTGSDADGANARLHASLPALWLGASMTLAAIYGVQETLEGAGAFAGSAWIGLALAVPAGFLVALAMRGADAAEALRTPGAVLRAFVVHASARAVRASATPLRLPDLRVGARGPPVASVV
jgi:hypothetical protein